MITEKIPAFYKYLLQYYPTATLQEEKVIDININKPHFLSISPRTFEALDRLGIAVYQKGWLREYWKTRMFTPIITFDIYGNIFSKEEYTVEYVYSKEIEELLKHVKIFFVPNSIKFIRSL